MEPHHKSSNKLQSKKRSAATREMQLEEQIIVLKKELQSNNEKYKEMLSKKDGHITTEIKIQLKRPFRTKSSQKFEKRPFRSGGLRPPGFNTVYEVVAPF
eukprot:TRINITY_DN8240_c0_g1_i1.p1 TRINITY_DN8240_c0_g1~~TRINITY_DN8240_c0_g1_i1.p1  ORF type:complete len:100 (-),score=6.41 TRINITY_DN8240_c0_g1_i1:97-396(-)